MVLQRPGPAGQGYFLKKIFLKLSYPTNDPDREIDGPEICTVKNVKPKKMSELLQSSVTVVDVRTAAEFMDGHCLESINVPMNEIEGRIDEIRKMKNIVVVCASGIRSKKASRILKNHGVDCNDGGPWQGLNNSLDLNRL